MMRSRPRHQPHYEPFYWRKLKVVHPIFEALPPPESQRIMTMMMTHPGREDMMNPKP